MQRQHRQAGKNIGEQHVREPRQRGEQRQRGDSHDQHARVPAQSKDAQDQSQHPQGERRLRQHCRPEVGPRQRIKEEAVNS